MLLELELELLPNMLLELEFVPFEELLLLDNAFIKFPELSLESLVCVFCVKPSQLLQLPPKKEHKTSPNNKIKKRNNASIFIV